MKKADSAKDSFSHAFRTALLLEQFGQGSAWRGLISVYVVTFRASLPPPPLPIPPSPRQSVLPPSPPLFCSSNIVCLQASLFLPHTRQVNHQSNLFCMPYVYSRQNETLGLLRMPLYRHPESAEFLSKSTAFFHGTCGASVAKGRRGVASV